MQETATSGYRNGPECYVDSPNNVSVSGGYLNLTARKEAAAFTCQDGLASYSTQYTSGMVSTYRTPGVPGQGFAQAYGRFEIRAKVSDAQVKGLQESFWLWPDDDTTYGSSWPDSGEIDIAEIFHLYPDRAIP